MTNESIELKQVVNYNSSENVYLYPNHSNSFLNKIFKQKELKKFSKEPIFFFTHSYGYVMEDIEKSKEFNQNFDALAYYFSDTKQKALGII